MKDVICLISKGKKITKNKHSKPSRSSSPGLKEVQGYRLIREDNHVQKTDGHGHRAIRGRGHALAKGDGTAPLLCLQDRVLFSLFDAGRRLAWEG